MTYNPITGKFYRDGYAAIRIDFKYHHLGTFATEQEAHDKYCSVARQVAGEFAWL